MVHRRKPDVDAPLPFRQQLLGAIPRLRRYARTLVFDAHAADDMVQATLERALTHWHRFDQSRDILVWELQALQPQIAGGGDPSGWLQRAAVAHAVFVPERCHPVEARCRRRFASSARASSVCSIGSRARPAMRWWAVCRASSCSRWRGLSIYRQSQPRPGGDATPAKR